MKIALAQMNATVGDLAGNAARILELARESRAAGACLMLTPELALCGYPPEDLSLRTDFHAENARVLADLLPQLPADLCLVLGHPLMRDGKAHNAASVIHGGRIQATYHKRRLPNYAVFDEARTFHPGDGVCVFDWGGQRFGVNICEDIWDDEAPRLARDAGAQVLLVMNASPFHMDKLVQRHDLARARARACALPIVYVNLVGGQDELVFDGASFAVDANGEVVTQAPQFQEALHLVAWRGADPHGEMTPLLTPEAGAYQALVTGLRDYVRKNGFTGVLLGLSGGVDSALVLVLAVDALGADRVKAVMMPSQFTADISLEDAETLAGNLGVRYDVQPIKRMFDTFLDELADEFEGLPFDQTEENIQARIRGVLLMALSNKFGQLVLVAGNKSEMACGYATLYGDMAGGLAVLKDVCKTLVWRLARYRNTLAAVIPERIITRPPSAELRVGQTDQDSLPPYEVLDGIMVRYVEQDMAPRDIVAAGFRVEDVAHVVRLIDRAEYKRRQSPPGIRITSRGFGRDRRYPITSRYQAPFQE
ncbi:MAG TPA: NAD+ synthase [Thiobacillaceae bacterium]|nr:NAD+ synthase [Thiobacillaceae bacterium]HNU65299.1 NAD+ synthase [Thiobacillaceae bacterium]